MRAQNLQPGHHAPMLAEPNCRRIHPLGAVIGHVLQQLHEAIIATTPNIFCKKSFSVTIHLSHHPSNLKAFSIALHILIIRIHMKLFVQNFYKNTFVSPSVHFKHNLFITSLVVLRVNLPHWPNMSHTWRA